MIRLQRRAQHVKKGKGQIDSRLRARARDVPDLSATVALRAAACASTARRESSSSTTTGRVLGAVAGL